MMTIDDLKAICRDAVVGVKLPKSVVEKLVAVAEAANTSIEAFKGIDDGLYTGLIPPELLPVAKALAALEAE